MNKKFFIISTILASAIIISGCIDQKDEMEIKTSLIEIRVGDIPIDNFSHIYVEFSEIKLYKYSSKDSGWVNISTVPSTIDLIFLHVNNLTKRLGLKEIEIGNYSKFWVTIDNASGELKETGEQVNIDVPSDTLKIQHWFNISKGNNTITFDIDLNNSIHEYGEGDFFKLLPVISELNVSYGNGTTIRFRNTERIINYGNGTTIMLQDNNTLRNMIENRKPTIDLIVNGSRSMNIRADVNESIVFNASETFDIDDDPITFLWDFGDNNSGTGSVATHKYTRAGTYQVTLIASDGELEDTVKATLTITKKEDHKGNNGNVTP